ncbi:MAG: histidinol dehydrogenase [Flavobacteriales bacterium]|nr:histidinol dehydrogenase [Flavobacteriales bacterium]
MKKYVNPDRIEWGSLTNRPVLDQTSLFSIISDIFKDVEKNGDQALIELTRKFDNCDLLELRVRKYEFESAIIELATELKEAINVAKSNIEKFHRSQILKESVVETQAGVYCWRENRAIENVGLYIPGGTAPLFSTILMLGIPAKLAGCKNIILCTPPDKNGQINPAILYTAQICGIDKIYKVGGAQAIAAMTYGTTSIPRMDKIFGPGNQYVTKAKEMAQQFGVAIDMPAGPSEVLIIANETSVPSFVAADLLSQAEHGKDSQVILLSTSDQICNEILQELEIQVSLLPRKSEALGALANSKAIVFDDLDKCVEFSNIYGPEHLILALDNARDLVPSIMNAGSVFIGNYSCESAGDYASGTNHTLPTNGYAKSYSGVSIDSFIKKITFQELNEVGIRNIGPTIEIMAEAEQLFAHKNAVSLRLKSLRS